MIDTDFIEKVSALTEAVDEVLQSKTGPKGEKGDIGPMGPAGRDGVSPVTFQGSNEPIGAKKGDLWIQD